MWGHINMAMMKAGLNPRVIRDVLSNLNKFKKMRVKVEDNIQEENCPDCNEDPCKCKSLQEALKINYVLIDTSRNDKVIAMSSDEQGVKDSMRTANLTTIESKK